MCVYIYFCRCMHAWVVLVCVCVGEYNCMFSYVFIGMYIHEYVFICLWVVVPCV